MAKNCQCGAIAGAKPPPMLMSISAIVFPLLELVFPMVPAETLLCNTLCCLFLLFLEKCILLFPFSIGDFSPMRLTKLYNYPLIPQEVHSFVAFP